MKRILSLLFALALTHGLLAQANSAIKVFSKKDHSEINGTTYNIYGDGASPIIKEEFKTVLVGYDSLKVAVKRYELNVISGTFDYFCWYLCYPHEAAGAKSLWAPEDSLTIYEGDTIFNLSVYLEPEMNKGTACYRYVMVPGENPADSSFFEICFKIETVGIKELNQIEMDVYPNPASDQLVLEGYDTQMNNAYARFFDLTGKLIFRKRINAGINRIDISNLPNGMYHCEIRTLNSELLTTEKVIIY